MCATFPLREGSVGDNTGSYIKIGEFPPARGDPGRSGRQGLGEGVPTIE
jgi:hypothetical protein